MKRCQGWAMAFAISAALWCMIILSIMCAAGCEQGDGTIVTDPNTISQLETVAEGAVGLTQALGALWPALIPIGTAAGGVFATYKRLKPKIKESEEQGYKYYAAGETLANILEDIKINEPLLWKKIGPKIADATKTVSDIEDTIRGFRHLPPI